MFGQLHHNVENCSLSFGPVFQVILYRLDRRSSSAVVKFEVHGVLNAMQGIDFCLKEDEIRHMQTKLSSSSYQVLYMIH